MLNIMFFSSFAIGHFLEMRRSVGVELENFKRTNQLTIYKSQIEASRKAFDVTIMRSMMRATRSGFRLSLYISSVVCGTFMIQAAQNKSSWFDLSLSYAVVSSIARIHRGPTGMLVAGSLGGLLGMVVSAPYWYYQKTMQATYPERRLRVEAYEMIAYRNAEERESEEQSIVAIDAKLYEEEMKKNDSRLDLNALKNAFHAVRTSFRENLGLPNDQVNSNSSSSSASTK